MGLDSSNFFRKNSSEKCMFAQIRKIGGTTIIVMMERGYLSKLGIFSWSTNRLIIAQAGSMTFE
jgi:hypothetical protein